MIRNVVAGNAHEIGIEEAAELLVGTGSKLVYYKTTGGFYILHRLRDEGKYGFINLLCPYGTPRYEAATAEDSIRKAIQSLGINQPRSVRFCDSIEEALQLNIKSS